MILGIGTDLTQIIRIAKTLARHGDRFIQRCFAETERAYVESAAKGDAVLRAAGYAKRWAAKEATAKALGLGVRDEIYMKDIVVQNNAAGRPSLVLAGGAKERLTALTPDGMTATAYLSLTDETENSEGSIAGLAMAFVVIEAEREK